MATADQAVRVRFAPSPTGHLHIGGLRTALFNWLFAQRHQGTYFLRIEDTDLERSRQEYTDSILEALAWAGLSSPEPVVYQTSNSGAHCAVIDQLLREDKAYKCYCTRADVVRRVTGSDVEPPYLCYDRYCLKRPAGTSDDGTPYTVRFRIPDGTQSVVFDDLVRGRVEWSTDQLDDFVIARSDGSPMFNLVNMLDDASMRITHVIRGEDHISNTPKQILLYQALGFNVPTFAHLPMILNQEGGRLSKRDGAVSALEYRREGYLPDALCNYLARLGWGHADQEIFTRQELVELFDVRSVSKSGAVFDPEKLQWVNSVYLHALAPDAVRQIMLRDVVPAGEQPFTSWSTDQTERFIKLYTPRVKTLRELYEQLRALEQGPHQYDEAAEQEWMTPERTAYLTAAAERLQVLETWTHELISQVLKQYLKEVGASMADIAQPLRLALTGTVSSPGVFDLLALLGRDDSLTRLQRFLAFLAGKKGA